MALGVLVLLLISCVIAIDEKVLIGKLEHIADAQFVVNTLMLNDLERGQVFCTNRTNPLAPLVKPFCQEKEGNNLDPVCSLTESIPDPVLGCPIHGNNVNTK